MVAEVDELDGLFLRKVGVGDDHLLNALLGEHIPEVLESPQGAQTVLGPRREGEVTHDIKLRSGFSGERLGHSVDVLSGPDQQRPPCVAGPLQQPAGHVGMQVPEASDVDGSEEQRSIEGVVARVVLAVRQREHERDHRGLEQGGDDAGQPWPPRPLGV